MKRFWKRVRHRLESVGVTFLRWIIPWLSRRGAMRLARWMGEATWRLAPQGRKVAEANHRIAFPDATDAERERVLRASLANFAGVGIDMFWSTRINESNWTDWFEFEGRDLGDRLIARGRGAIAIIPHLGNWEMMSIASTSAGYPLSVVVHPLNNPLLNDWFDRHRSRAGAGVIHRDGATRPLLRALRSGEVVGLLVDQNTKPAEGGMFVDFFGLPATITRAPAVLALRTGAAILLARGIPLPDGRWRIVYGPEIEPCRDADPETAIRETTRRCAAAMEAAIRADPHLWLWMYKRWKYLPRPDAPGYPPYATKVLPDPAATDHS